MIIDLVPRSVHTPATIIRSQQPSIVRWKTFRTLHSLLKACDAKPDFATQLGRLVLKCFPESGDSGSFVANLQSLSVSTRISTVVAIDRKVVVGLSQTHFTNSSTGMIVNLCRAPGKRYKGLGLDMLRRARDLAEDGCASRVILWTKSSNRKLQRHYERCGWRVSRFIDKGDVVEYEYVVHPQHEVIFEM
jgi:hypothetical protein